MEVVLGVALLQGFQSACFFVCRSELHDRNTSHRVMTGASEKEALRCLGTPVQL
jgi:hypothetical protein